MSDEADVESYWGICPKCLRNDGFLNVGRHNWVVCHEHKARWCVGSNLFSNHLMESAADWERNKAILEGYENVQPLVEARA